MAKEPTKAKTEEATRLQGYLDAVVKYEREYKKWEERSRKIIRRYRDERRENTSETSAAKFNILWSNVQILVPATFARVPQPDVSRRFRDQDPVGRVAALMLERGLEFEVQHYPDYRDTMTQVVHDRFLGGRGTAWVRYEPHFKEAPEQAGVPEKPDDGVQVSEDVEAEAPEEQLDYECAPVDYVHWKDFGHSVARTWEEVTLVWRRVYMSEAAVTERFGEEIAKKIPYDSTPEDLKRADRNAQTDVKQQACVFELWDKEEGIACWFSKSMKEFLDEKPDPLKLQQFFPCPKPLYATLTNDTLVPVPDFTLYQDQARALDTLADRAYGLINMLQVKGVYDGAADASLASLFTEGSNGTLLAVKNWAAFAEKNGLKGQIDVIDLTPIAKALESVYLAADQQKQQVYEIMGISDIVRGASDPNETLGAQELKGQYASMRLKAMQADVSRFATDVLQIKAQVMCSKFNPQTLVAISAAEQLSEVDKQAVPQALALLVGPERLQDPEAESPNPLRSFRIDVNADSMIQMNEAAEKKDRMEFLTANGAFMEKATQMAAQAGAAAPIIVPLIMEMWKFGVTGFKVGKTVEGQFDEAADKLKELAKNPPPPAPDPEVAKAQAKAQADGAKAQADAQATSVKEAEITKREQLASQEKVQLDAQAKQAEDAAHARETAQKDTFDRWKAELEADTKIIVAEISASASAETAQIGADAKAESAEGAGTAKPKRASPLKAIAQAQADFMEKIRVQGETLAASQAEMSEHMRRMSEDAQAPVVGKRGPDGRIGSVQRGAKMMRVVRGPDGVSLVPETRQ